MGKEKTNYRDIDINYQREYFVCIREGIAQGFKKFKKIGHALYSPIDFIIGVRFMVGRSEDKILEDIEA